MSGTRTYRIWKGMLRRCFNPNDKSYCDYGGRGTTCHENWFDFECFYGDMGHAPRGKSLDRVNNDGDYEPRNCRWATQLEQVNNRRCSWKNKR
jgi:hypothetical protein